VLNVSAIATQSPPTAGHDALLLYGNSPSWSCLDH